MMKSLLAGLTLAATCMCLNPAFAQDNRTTAGDVVDRETLMAFVEGAKDSLDGAADFAAVGRGPYQERRRQSADAQDDQS